MAHELTFTDLRPNFYTISYILKLLINKGNHVATRKLSEKQCYIEGGVECLIECKGSKPPVAVLSHMELDMASDEVVLYIWPWLFVSLLPNLQGSVWCFRDICTWGMFILFYFKLHYCLLGQLPISDIIYRLLSTHPSDHSVDPSMSFRCLSMRQVCLCEASMRKMWGSDQDAISLGAQTMGQHD